MKNYMILSCLSVLFFLQLNLAYAKTLYVGDGNHLTIQSAVNAANDGDEIIVKPGTYTENIRVDKSLCIRSEKGYTHTTINAKSSYSRGFYITKNNVTIDGFTVCKTFNESAIELASADKCRIINNRLGFEGCVNETSIELYYSDNNTITNNICSKNNLDGIYMEASHHNDISQNIIQDNQSTGIDIDKESTANVISQNTLSSNQDYGIRLYENSSSNYIYLNSFIDNTIAPIKTYVEHQNIWYSQDVITYEYHGKRFCGLLGNYYSGHDDNITNENGVSEFAYNFPYYEPYDEYPLLKPHDHYKILSHSTEDTFPPVIISVIPSNDRVNGGTEITIMGANFGAKTGQVFFGESLSESIVEWSYTKIVCVSPPHEAAYVPVRVTTDDQYSGCKQNAFLYYDQYLYVGEAEIFSGIQEAILAASDGLTLVVRDGVYHENIVINKSIAIISDSGAQSTTIAGKDPDAHVVECIANDMTLKGFSIYGATNNRAGINIMADGCKIVNNICGISEHRTNQIGIKLHSSIIRSINHHQTHTIVSGNQCDYNLKYGIYAYKVAKSDIANNRVSFNRLDGLYIVESTSNTLFNNECTQNSGHGMCFNKSDGNTILSNSFQFNNNCGIRCKNSSKNNTIFHNSFLDNQKSQVCSDTNCMNKWFSDIPLNYELNETSLTSRLGNYFSDHVLTDTDQNGVTDNGYGLPYYETIDQYPLAYPSYQYHIQLFHLTDKYLTESIISSQSDDMQIDKGRTYLWISDTPAKQEIVNDQEMIWNGQIVLKEPASQNTLFRMNIGVSPDGKDFISYGFVEVPTHKQQVLPFQLLTQAFTIPENHHLAVRMTNMSGIDYSIKIGAFVTFFSKQNIRDIPDIIGIKPDFGPSTGETIVTITGSSFGEAQGSQKVMFGNREAVSYQSWTNTCIVCTSPVHAAGRFPVWISNASSRFGTIGQFIFKDHELRVGINEMYPSIQSAIAAAVDNDVVIVADGRYKENLLLEKPVTIRSENGYTSTILTPNNPDDETIQLKHDHCGLDGFTIDAGNTDIIKISGSDYCSIANNKMGTKDITSNTTTGIYLAYSDHNSVEQNIISNIYSAIKLFESSDNKIQKNRITANDRGIILDRSDQNAMMFNECTENQFYGIGLYNRSFQNLITGNVCLSNGEHGIYVSGNDNTLVGNHCHLNAACGININGTNNTLTENTLKVNTTYGIYCNGSANVLFNNTLEYNSTDVYSDDSSHIWQSPIHLHYIYQNNIFYHSMGNKYSSIFSSDQNQDGIYDEFYYIVEDNKDSYPLYKPHDNYSMTIWGLQSLHRMDQQFSETINIVHLDPESCHTWIAVSDGIMLTDQLDWSGQIMLEQPLANTHKLTVAVGYDDGDQVFQNMGSPVTIAGDGTRNRLTAQGTISPPDLKTMTLAVQICNQSASSYPILTGGAWSFFSIGQKKNDSSLDIQEMAQQTNMIIPDSGQEKCYNNNQEIECPQAGDAFYGQDGNYLINPRSYDKLDEWGNTLPDDALSWQMVRDNVTCLIWEVKSASDGQADNNNPHDPDNLYSFKAFNPKADSQQSNLISNPIVTMNEERFGGFSDWRMPDISELSSIVHSGQKDLAIDLHYFPNTMASYYWTSTRSYNNENYAWGVDFSNGDDHSLLGKEKLYYVRAVRSGQKSSSDRLVENLDGTITDISTGLMWLKAFESNKTWEDALQYCETLETKEFQDWRLPAKEELRSIVDHTFYNPSLNTNLFPDAPAYIFWTSTPSAESLTFAWGIHFERGFDYYRNKSNTFYVRPVRGGQTHFSDRLMIQNPRQASHWETGDIMPVIWETKGISGNVCISLSRQGGKQGTFERIAESTPNDGEFHWIVEGAGSVNCMLKIEPENAYELLASQGLFCITDFVPQNLESQSHQIGICNTDMTIEISWEAPNVWGKNIEAYRVLWDHSFNTVPEKGEIVTENIHSSPNLSEGNQHYVHIRVKDDQGHWGNNTAHLGPFCIEYPDVEPPKGLQVSSAKDNTIELKWYHMDAVFNVYRSYSADGFYIKCDPSELTGARFTDSKIIENTPYWYKISAINDQGEESFLSEPVSAMCKISRGDIKLKCDNPHQMQIAGGTAIFKILLNTGGSFDDQITMGTDGLGDNISISFAPKIVTQKRILSLSIDISDQKPAGHYDFNVTAISDNNTAILPLFLDVINPPAENAVISAYANPDSVQLSETVNIYGNIRPPQSNVSVWVYIQHESDDEPFIYQTTSNEDANFNIQYLPSKTGKYMVNASCDAHQAFHVTQSLETQFTVLRGSARLTCMASKEKELTNQGAQVTLVGKLSPAFKGQLIDLEKINPFGESEKIEHRIVTTIDGSYQYTTNLPIEGEWEIRACWKGNERYQGVVSQPLKLYPGLKAGRILIVAGGGKENNNLWEPIEYLTKQFYSMLINRQCTHDMICYISPDTSNTNESIIIDDSSPEVNDIKNYIQQLYIGKPLPDVDKDRPFLIYLADHGAPGKFQVNQGNEILDAKDLDEWLDKLQYETNCPVHIIIESCYSGTFVETIAPTPDQQRVIITSTGNYVSRYSRDGRESFSRYLFDQLIIGNNLADSFNFASEALNNRYIFNGQYPMIEDGHALEIAKSSYIGNSFIIGNIRPEIIDHTKPQTLSAGPGELFVKVVDIGKINHVWATIMPPHYQLPEPTQNYETPVIDLPTIDLNNKGNGRYEGNYQDFKTNGMYRVTFYCEDSDGMLVSKEILLNVEDSQVSPGDLNEDGFVNISDAILSMQVLSGMNVSVADASRILCGESPGACEVIFILQMVAGMK